MLEDHSGGSDDRFEYDDSEVAARERRLVAQGWPAAEDGWRAVLYPGDELEPEYKIYLVYTEHGEHREELLVAQFPSCETSTGGVAQELLLWNALARYANSGGQLSDVLPRLQAAMKLPHMLNQRRLPAGYFLKHTGIIWYEDSEYTENPDDDNDGHHERAEHLFVSNIEGKCFHWIEDVKAELVRLEEPDGETAC
jgi:hypothetical protein